MGNVPNISGIIYQNPKCVLWHAKMCACVCISVTKNNSAVEGFSQQTDRNTDGKRLDIPCLRETHTHTHTLLNTHTVSMQTQPCLHIVIVLPLSSMMVLCLIVHVPGVLGQIAH